MIGFAEISARLHHLDFKIASGSIPGLQLIDVATGGLSAFRLNQSEFEKDKKIKRLKVFKFSELLLLGPTFSGTALLSHSVVSVLKSLLVAFIAKFSLEQQMLVNNKFNLNRAQPLIFSLELKALTQLQPWSFDSMTRLYLHKPSFHKFLGFK